MRIEYLELVNFARIFSGMKKKRIRIDLRDNQNRIILLKGPNGSGKTAILSRLQPFAYSDDIGDLIIPGENGSEIIHIRHNDILYIIHHKYTWAREAHTVKSFICKNDEDLNPNGNQMSFKEIVSLELGIDYSYLKLIRLGANVTNFIDMKSTDRKSFSSNLLSDIDVYAKMYKTISERSRLLNNLRNIVSKKIERMGVFDESQITDEIHEYKMHKNDALEVKEKTAIEYATDTKRAESILNGEDPLEFRERVYTARSLRDKLQNRIDSHIKKIEHLNAKIPDTVESDINNEKISIEKSIDNLIFENKTVQSSQDTLYKNKESMESLLHQLKDGDNYDNIKNFVSTLEMELSNSKFNSDSQVCAKKDLVSAMNVMIEIKNVVDVINEFDRRLVKDVIGLIVEGKCIKTFVETNVNSVDSEIQKFKLRDFENNLSISSVNFILYRPADCTIDSCPYLKLFREKKSKLNSTDINLLESKRTDNLIMLDIYKNIEYITMIIKSNSELIKRIPTGLIDIEDILNKIFRNESVYCEGRFSTLINTSVDYEKYVNVIDALKDAKGQLDKYSINKQTIDIVSRELDDLNSAISKNNQTFTETKNRIGHLNDGLQYVNSVIDIFTDINDNKKAIDDLMIEYVPLVDNVNKGIEHIGFMKDLIKNVENYKKTITQCDYDIDKYENLILNSKIRLSEFNQLKKEKLEIEEKYEEVFILKESLSSSKGLPLLFIKLYMEDVKMRVNELLNIVYDGNLEIHDFIIDDKEFNIPYNKSGIIISDIAKASQGEKSFISTALSFALIKQSLDKYNIVLLDEIDATLDYRNRGMFISILEKQLELLNSEQCFVISHNNMFDDYPVSVILTDENEDIDNFKNVNIIKIH